MCNIDAIRYDRGYDKGMTSFYTSDSPLPKLIQVCPNTLTRKQHGLLIRVRAKRTTERKFSHFIVLLE